MDFVIWIRPLLSFPPSKTVVLNSLLYVSGATNADLNEGCVQANPNDLCAQRSCAVEGGFVQNLFAVFLSGAIIDYVSFSHVQGFESAIDCPTKSGPGAGSPTECCGDYPFRFPYKTLNGERGCCQKRTYNTNNLNCCTDGRVKVSC